MMAYPHIRKIRKLHLRSYYICTTIITICFHFLPLQAQIDNDGCVGANFGVDGDLYSDQLQYGNQGGVSSTGTDDWFQTTSGSGLGIIDESNTTNTQTLIQGYSNSNPIFEIRMNYEVSSIVSDNLLIDAVYARDHFGGSGATDQTSYVISSKNGDDPRNWNGGPGNVLGKNDILDIGGHMRHSGPDATDDLWFFGFLSRADPGGSAYMDFEFFVEELHYHPNNGFSTAGAQGGHTAFEFDNAGNITKMGDLIFNLAAINGGEVPDVGVRLWVRYADFIGTTPTTFQWGSEYDGAYNGAPYGYAEIIPLNVNDACGIINTHNQSVTAPPWGHKGTKQNNYQTSFNDFATIEVGINVSTFGVDYSTIPGYNACFFPYSSLMVKTRSSASFTSELKDFTQPYLWGVPTMNIELIGDPTISCLNTPVTLIADPPRTDVIYSWTTLDGNIVSDPTQMSILVDEPGTYLMSATLPSGCALDDVSFYVALDETSPPFLTPITITSVSCEGDDGAIDLTVSGANPPYSYLWSNGATTEDLSGLAPGTYSVTISTPTGCMTTASATLPMEVPQVLAASSVDQDCNGSNIGSIDLTASGQAPFSYLWPNGSTTEDISDLAAGDYTVTVTDADGCTATTTITITEPDAISLSISSTDETAIPANDGTIDLTVTGGTPSYTYLWSNAATTEDLVNLASGVYTVTVTDSNGCTAIISAPIYEPETCDDGLDNNGNGLLDCADPVCQPTTPGTITEHNTAPCVGDSNISYSIVDVGAPLYDWTVPSGATITNGQGTTTITVTWDGDQGGQICVQSNNVGCLSDLSCITVAPNDVPSSPSNLIISNE